MKRIARPFGLALAAGLLALPALAQDDVYIQSKTHTDAINMMGRSIPAQDGTSHTWVGGGKIAIRDEMAGQIVIFRPEEQRMYILFPGEKTYYESKLPFELPPEMAQMMAAVKPEVAVIPTDETRVVNGYDTKLTRVNIKMMGQDIAMEYWVSKDLGVSGDEVRKVTQAMFAGNPLLGELGEKMSAIDGYPVRIDTRVTAMGSTFASWQEVQKVEKKPAPAGTYEVPKDYTRTETLKIGRS